MYLGLQKWIQLFSAFMTKYLCSINRLIGLMGRVFANGPGDRGSIPGHVIPKT